MIKNFLILLLCITLIKCKKVDTENGTSKVLDNEIIDNVETFASETKFTPIFIGLSPKMSDESFSEEITKLNNENKLIDNKFSIIVGDENYLFDVKKSNNSIRLNYSTQETKAFENVSYQISDNYLNKYNSEKNKFIKIFDSKYKLNDYQIPTNIYLQNYNLNKEHYKLYKDKEKSILIGYTIIGDRYPSQQEKEIIEQEKRSKVADHPLENIGDFISSDQRSNYAKFGIEIEINYYHNDEMQNLLNTMKNESDKLKESENQSRKNDLQKTTNAKNNINEL